MLALQKFSLNPGLRLSTAAAYPTKRSDEVIVQVTHVGICGSDVHAYQLDADYSFMAEHLPVTMGHEFSGIVTESTDARYPTGTRVCVIPSIGCGKCSSCRNGEERDCDNGSFIGYTRNGGFANFVAVPANNLLVIPTNVDNRLAALTEPLTISAEAVLVGGVAIGDVVIVLGVGTIGQAAAIFARDAGASKVIVVGFDDAPRFKTLRKLGFEDFIDVSRESLGDGLARLNASSLDCAIEASGSSSSFTSVLRFLRKGGRLVLCGIYPNEAKVDLTDLVRRRIAILSTYRSRTSTWHRVINSISASPHTFEALISHELEMRDFEAAFDLAIKKESSKVLLTP